MSTALKVISINIEGFSSAKKIIIEKICHDQNCHVLCLQETHRGPDNNRPLISDMKMAIESPHRQYGSAIFVRSDIPINSTSSSCTDNIELLHVTLQDVTITSVYKPPTERFAYTDNHIHSDAWVIIGDFNSHSTNWGYSENDENGDLVEAWADNNQLSLIHDPKLPSSFNSGRWKRGFNPDIGFVSQNIAALTSKKVLDPIPHTQHRPISLEINAAIRPQSVAFRRRFNFRKANWEKFTADLDSAITSIDATPSGYVNFVDALRRVSRKTIPRGCRSSYIPGLTGDLIPKYNHYIKLYEADPFAANTIAAGEELVDGLALVHRKTWEDLISNVNMTHNSKKAWATIKKLSFDQSKAEQHPNVTANQIAHQLLLNGKPPSKLRNIKRQRQKDVETTNFSQPFSHIELDSTIKLLKSGKAAGQDDICSEQLTHFGPLAKTWLLQLFNTCKETDSIPKVWRQSKVIAILKPGKEPSNPKSYRPISLLSNLYKLYERLILNRLQPIIEEKLISEQAGFRPGKSCTGQILNMTQYIEDGFETGCVTGAVLVDLSAAYDTVNHRRLLDKVYQTTKDHRLCMIIQTMLSNRRFFVTLGGQRSRWRIQRNGLPQGSVLAPTLFNIYTNDQPIHPGTRSFVYADDLAITAQAKQFSTVETTLTDALSDLTRYYCDNLLRPNPSKTQITAFHLRNRDAGKHLNVTWNGQPLQHCDNPVYLGVTLDRTLTYKSHILKTRAKVSSRNAIVRKLTHSKWGANPSTVRATALALSYSVAEYACPVWERSTHAAKLDPALNDCCRIITGCLRPTPKEHLYTLAGIAPPNIRRAVASQVERSKQMDDTRHPLFDHTPAKPRLKSRRSFCSSTMPLRDTAVTTRTRLWRDHQTAMQRNTEMMMNIPAAERLPSGANSKWTTWKSLNRLRTQVGRCHTNMAKWGLRTDSDICECGEKQTMSHLLCCRQLHTPVTANDLSAANDVAILCADHWRDTI